MNKITLNNGTPDTFSNTSNAINSSQLGSNIKQKSQMLHPIGKPIDKDSRAIKSFDSFHTEDKSDTNYLPSPLRDLNVIISPTEANYHRKVELEDADIKKGTKEHSEKLCNDYTDNFFLNMWQTYERLTLYKYHSVPRQAWNL